ncbi:substrate-binding periplasmic protein [Kordiimonas sp.]|uniref:substrate-binding periplasmic protein n=1 Tax=Kordiimonas sp. TaxID=1970157 RepID=UPI003A93D4B2
MKYRFAQLTILFSFLLLTSPTSSAEVTVYTEDYPPYNYVGDDGTIEGIATAKVRQVLDAAGLDYEIRMVPWSRAVLYAGRQDNALIYTITRTPLREEQYDWLVPVATSNFYLYARADDPRPVTPDALRSGMFSAACVTGDLTCDLLATTGIPEERIVYISDSNTGDFRLVVAGRADLYISELAANSRLRHAGGFDLDVTKPTLRLGGKTGFYLASGKHVSPELRSRIRRSYNRLQAQGRYHLAAPLQTDELGQ